MSSVLVCYSGGVDSALVLAVAHEVLGERCIGMTAVSPSLAPFEKEEAIAIAQAIGARHELVDSNEIEDEATFGFEGFDFSVTASGSSASTFGDQAPRESQ